MKTKYNNNLRPEADRHFNAFLLWKLIAENQSLYITQNHSSPKVLYIYEHVEHIISFV